VNVDTGVFLALTERVDALDARVTAMTAAEEILRRAGMPERGRGVDAPLPRWPRDRQGLRLVSGGKS
jgi:hypothetical protein